MTTASPLKANARGEIINSLVTYEGDPLERFKDSEALVVGLARNCGQSVGKTVRLVNKALNSVRKLSWLVVESDSTDDTVRVLDRLSKEDQRFRFLTLGLVEEKIPLRTERIAHCRNVYLDELLQNPTYEGVDYLFVVDMDGVNDRLTEQGVSSCWRFSGWDVCTANQAGPYYDIWALRHEIWCPGDCWNEYQFLVSLGAHQHEALATVRAKMIRIPEDAKWISVRSAFGGLAIYKRSAIGAARYCGLTDSGLEQCEHVSFHERMRESGARLFINPALINGGFNDHTQNLKFPLRIPAAMRNQLTQYLRHLANRLFK